METTKAPDILESKSHHKDPPVIPSEDGPLYLTAQFDMSVAELENPDGSEDEAMMFTLLFPDRKAGLYAPLRPDELTPLIDRMIRERDNMLSRAAARAGKAN
jgi:hypothetical protein